MQADRQKRRRRLLDIEYKCIDCGVVPPIVNQGMVCTYCLGRIRGSSAGITGTRDNFGISKIFKDDQTGKEIDTWKKWEKAGYRNPMETTKSAKVKELAGEKIKRVKNS